MFIKFVDIDWLSVMLTLVCSLRACHMYQESTINPRFTREISKFQKSELGKFIPNFPLKHVITRTNTLSQFENFDTRKKISKLWK